MYYFFGDKYNKIIVKEEKTITEVVDIDIEMLINSKTYNL